MSRKIMWFAGTVVCAWAALFLTIDPSQAAGHGGGGHGGGGHGGGGFHGGGFHGGGFHGGGFHGSGFRAGGWGGRGWGHYGGWGHRGYYGGGWGRGYYGGFYPGWYGLGLWDYPYYSYGYGDYPSYPYGVWNYPNYGYSDSSYDANESVPSMGAGIASQYGTYAPPASTDDTAHVTVRVSADAQVWFENRPTTQRGAVREYQSPQLTPGKDYTYNIRARWQQDGRAIEQTRHVDVHAGSQVTVDFTAPAADQAPVSTGTSS
jgi:uncharacterized protein (TIGR03000 family)